MTGGEHRRVRGSVGGHGPNRFENHWFTYIHIYISLKFV